MASSNHHGNNQLVFPFSGQAPPSITASSRGRGRHHVTTSSRGRNRAGAAPINVPMPVPHAGRFPYAEYAALPAVVGEGGFTLSQPDNEQGRPAVSQLDTVQAGQGTKTGAQVATESQEGPSRSNGSSSAESGGSNGSKPPLRGVIQTRAGTWTAKITISSSLKSIGTFSTAEAASNAYQTVKNVLKGCRLPPNDPRRLKMFEESRRRVREAALVNGCLIRSGQRTLIMSPNTPQGATKSAGGKDEAPRLIDTDRDPRMRLMSEIGSKPPRGVHQQRGSTNWQAKFARRVNETFTTAEAAQHACEGKTPAEEHGRDRPQKILDPFQESVKKRGRDQPQNVAPSIETIRESVLKQYTFPLEMGVETTHCTPESASEVDFNIHNPPMTPIVKESTTPVCSSMSELNTNDVVLGNGTVRNQVGNMRYRDLVKDFQPAYRHAKMEEKPLLARSIVLIIRNRGGRFVKKGDADDSLYEVGDERAEAKALQALYGNLCIRATNDLETGIGNFPSNIIGIGSGGSRGSKRVRGIKQTDAGNWVAKIVIAGATKTIGTFSSAEAASDAYETVKNVFVGCLVPPNDPKRLELFEASKKAVRDAALVSGCLVDSSGRCKKRPASDSVEGNSIKALQALDQSYCNGKSMEMQSAGSPMELSFDDSPADGAEDKDIADIIAEEILAERGLERKVDRDSPAPADLSVASVNLDDLDLLVGDQQDWQYDEQDGDEHQGNGGGFDEWTDELPDVAEV